MLIPVLEANYVIIQQHEDGSAKQELPRGIVSQRLSPLTALPIVSTQLIMILPNWGVDFSFLMFIEKLPFPFQ